MQIPRTTTVGPRSGLIEMLEDTLVARPRVTMAVQNMRGSDLIFHSLGRLVGLHASELCKFQIEEFWNFVGKLSDLKVMFARIWLDAGSGHHHETFA